MATHRSSLRHRKLSMWSALPPYLGGKRAALSHDFPGSGPDPAKAPLAGADVPGRVPGRRAASSLYAKAQGFRVVATDIAERGHRGRGGPGGQQPGAADPGGRAPAGQGRGRGPGADRDRLQPVHVHPRPSPVPGPGAPDGGGDRRPCQGGADPAAWPSGLPCWPTPCPRSGREPSTGWRPGSTRRSPRAASTTTWTGCGSRDPRSSGSWPGSSTPGCSPGRVEF